MPTRPTDRSIGRISSATRVTKEPIALNVQLNSERNECARLRSASILSSSSSSTCDWAQVGASDGPNEWGRQPEEVRCAPHLLRANWLCVCVWKMNGLQKANLHQSAVAPMAFSIDRTRTRTQTRTRIQSEQLHRPKRSIHRSAQVGKQRVRLPESCACILLFAPICNHSPDWKNRTKPLPLCECLLRARVTHPTEFSSFGRSSKSMGKL